LIEIIRFCRTGTPPVSKDETIEIFAFMQAAEESKQEGGASIPSQLSFRIERGLEYLVS
jgi:hypothetical protein